MYRLFAEYAPVLIPTLNRIDLLKRCLESLENCYLAEKTDVYIALDYPPNERYTDGYKDVVRYLSNLTTQFKSFHIIKRQSNLGPQKNILRAMEDIFKTDDFLILSEDDNIFATDFLYFMNMCNSKFRDDSSVFSVTGYNYPIQYKEKIKSNIYLWDGHSGWGDGFWKQKFEKISWSFEKEKKGILKNLFTPSFIFRYQKKANHSLSALYHMIQMRELHGDGYVSYYQFIHGLYTVFPFQSKVRNIGHDGSGVSQSLEQSKFANQEIFSADPNYELSMSKEDNVLAEKAVREYFRRSIKDNVKMLVKIMLLFIRIRMLNKSK